MKFSRLLCGLLCILWSLPVWACQQPMLPILPKEGDDLSIRARVTLRIEVVRYVTVMTGYMECLQHRYEEAQRRNMSALALSLIAARYNLAITELDGVGSAYSARIGPIEDLSNAMAVTCVRTAPRPRRQIIDDVTVVYFDRRGDPYINFVDQCPILGLTGLSARDANIGGNAGRVSQVCALELTAVRDRVCMLGLFYPITHREMEEIRR